MPALLSTLTVSVVYLVMWESGYALPACVVAAGLVLLDTAHIAQTRLIYLDAILVFTMACSLLCYIKFSKLKSQAFSNQWWIWLFLTGLALSCAISTKYVGFFAFITIGTAVTIDLWGLFSIESHRAVSMLEFMKHFTARAVALVVIPFMLYLLWFYIHFAILIHSGSGDEYMSLKFAETLSRNTTSQQAVVPLSFFQKWFELQGLMFEYNGLVDSKHPYESRPYQWPLSLGGVSFWESDDTQQQIYFVGNVAGWWIASSLLLVFVIVIVVDKLSLGRGVKLIHDRKSIF
jgi:dolichyl-phosphate-mannose--protein O-mannosyl transferase